MDTEAGTKPKNKPWGVCSVCKIVVMEADKMTHPCPDYHVDTSWNAFANPHNKPWLPGYRFCVIQASQSRQRTRVHSRSREYRVNWEIDENGLLKWAGGVKPTDETAEKVAELYARNRPGSNHP